MTNGRLWLYSNQLYDVVWSDPKMWWGYSRGVPVRAWGRGRFDWFCCPGRLTDNGAFWLWVSIQVKSGKVYKYCGWYGETDPSLGKFRFDCHR